MKVRPLLVIFSILALLWGNSCETVDCQASCAAPPEGEIVAERINVTTTILVINNDGASVQIDGPVQFLAGESWIDMTNYTWTAVPPGETITSLRFVLDDTTYTIDQEDFTFNGTDGFETGSFLINIRLDSDQTTVSNDLLFLQVIPFDGRCDPGC